MASRQVFRAYGKLLSVDAGFVPGGTADVARLYWASFERAAAPSRGSRSGRGGRGGRGDSDGGDGCDGASATGAEGAAEGAEEQDFDLRSETLPPPRARFSPMGGGLVLGMDHDCPWVGGPVGHGNHVHFIALLLSGDIVTAAG